MKHDQRGFSLVELIVAVAIISILIGVGVRNLGVVQKYRVRECQDKLINAIQAHKIDALSKSVKNGSGSQCSDVTSMDSYLEIKRDNGFYYVTSYMPGTNRATTKISKSKAVKISYTVGGSATEIADGTSLYIGFNRATGAFLPYTNSPSKEYIEEIAVGYDGSNSGSVSNYAYGRFVKLQGQTGKILRITK